MQPRKWYIKETTSDLVGDPLFTWWFILFAEAQHKNNIYILLLCTFSPWFPSPWLSTSQALKDESDFVSIPCGKDGILGCLLKRTCSSHVSSITTCDWFGFKGRSLIPLFQWIFCLGPSSYSHGVENGCLQDNRFLHDRAVFIRFPLPVREKEYGHDQAILLPRFLLLEILAEEWGVSQKFLRNDSSISWEHCSIIFGDRSMIKFWDFNSMVTIGKKSPKHPKTVGMMVFIGDQHLSWVSQCFTHWYLLVTVVQDFLHQKISEVWRLFVATSQIVSDLPLTVSQPCVILLGARRFRITHEAPWRLFTWGGDSWLPGLLHFFAADFNHVWGDDFSWEKLLQRSTTNWFKDKNQPWWNPIQIWLKKKSICVTLRWISWQW